MPLIPVRYICAAALVLASPVLPAQALGVGLQPTTVEMEADPGQRQRQVLTIGNVSEDMPVSLTLGLADWTLSRDGEVVLSPPGETDRSAAGWTRLTPAMVTLAPGESHDIIVDMITPAKLAESGDYRFAVLASVVLPDQASGLLKRHDVSSLFYVTAAPAESAPAVRDIRLVRQPGGGQALELLIDNSGNAHARLEGRVRIEGGHKPLSVPVSNLVVLGDSQRSFRIPLDGPLPERAQVSVQFDNIFAPQVEGLVAPVRAFTAPLPVSRTTAPAD